MRIPECIKEYYKHCEKIFPLLDDAQLTNELLTDQLRILPDLLNKIAKCQSHIDHIQKSMKLHPKGKEARRRAITQKELIANTQDQLNVYTHFVDRLRAVLDRHRFSYAGCDEALDTTACLKPGDLDTTRISINITFNSNNTVLPRFFSHKLFPEECN